MTETKKIEKYPVWIVILSNTVSILIYGLGFLIMFRLEWIISILYLIFVSVQEFRLIKKHCINCFYWGKICGFGKGIISSWFFRKGDVSKFCIKEMTWKDMIPDFMVSLVPVITGIVLIIIKFDCVILIAVILLMLLSTLGNGIIRGSLICKYCKQKELGCPADRMFNKDK